MASSLIGATMRVSVENLGRANNRSNRRKPDVRDLTDAPLSLVVFAAEPDA
jgi:hypothetical protein